MLTLGGVDVRDLAARVGAPVVVTDEADVLSRAGEYAEAFGTDAHVAYAAKASAGGRCAAGDEEGLGVDVAPAASWRWHWPPGWTRR